MIGLALLPLLTIKPAKEGDETFVGSDDKAASAITEIRQDYMPWFGPVWKPPSAEIQSLLFSLQTAIGAGAVAYCLGYYRGQRHTLHDDSAQH